MLRSILYLFFVCTVIFAYDDVDFDGVIDQKDRCPATPITDLIDQHGCSIVKIMDADPVASHYDVILGIAYDSADYGTSREFKTVTNTFQANLFLDSWSAQFYTSYYSLDVEGSSNSKGFNDTSVSVYYNYRPFNEENLFLRFGLGATVPTQKSSYNEVDYTASFTASYIAQNYSLFCGYGYTVVGDEDTDYFKFQNTSSFNFGLGYYLKANIYTSLSYLNADSVIQEIEKIRNLSLYLFYGVNDNWFFTLSYSKGLTDATSDLSSNLRVGYYF